MTFTCSQHQNTRREIKGGRISCTPCTTEIAELSIGMHNTQRRCVAKRGTARVTL